MKAEYWADGVATSQPPGHWLRLAEFISSRDHHSLDDDVAMFFTLGNAMLDTSISAWEAKRFYDYVRPHHGDSMVLYAGKKVEAWGGPDRGTTTIDGSQFQPYDRLDEVTPPSPEYPSEESAFAAAGAEVIRTFTKSDAFGASHVTRRGESAIEPGRTPREDVELVLGHAERRGQASRTRATSPRSAFRGERRRRADLG